MVVVVVVYQILYMYFRSIYACTCTYMLYDRDVSWLLKRSKQIVRSWRGKQTNTKIDLLMIYQLNSVYAVSTIFQPNNMLKKFDSEKTEHHSVASHFGCINIV